jgi:DNA-binding IclR family transcriptional regulator
MNGSNKAKFAKRVIEVLEFFDEEHPQATVMDIVRRFNRPQSSTSELLYCLVEVGLLYKDPHSRSYSPTPRAAILGCAAQPSLVRDGRLTGLIDRLSAQTGLGVGVFGMVGLQVQIYSWRGGQKALRTSNPFGICGGQKDHLSSSAAGWLLLSAVAQPRRESMLRRLNAEAAPDRKFCVSDMAARVQQCQDEGTVTGSAGFDSNAQITAYLFPDLPQNQPLAIGFAYEPNSQIDPTLLLQTLTDSVERCFSDQSIGSGLVQPLFETADFQTVSAARASAAGMAMSMPA